MNQEQRKFLIEQVSHTHREQLEALEEQEPKKPSLNNYLVAAFLDNSIKFNDVGALKEKMREQVLNLGQQDTLIDEDNDDDYYGSRRKRKEKNNFVKLIAEDLFIIPDNYLKALKEYNKEKSEWDKKIEALNAQKKTILMKIQIGSNAVLDKLIEQVDNLADLNLINTQLLLTQ